MIPDKGAIKDLHKKYARNEMLYERFYTHCEIVSVIALKCAENFDKGVDMRVVESAALLHDIGSYLLCDEEGKIDKRYYQLHGLVGASILEDEGIDKRICDIVRTHQFSINTPEIVSFSENHSPNFNREPASIEAEIVSYADRFHSKQPIFNSEDFLIPFLEKLPHKRSKYEKYRKKFGLPDIKELAQRYKHPIR